jgi:hypothetical protein
VGWWESHWARNFRTGYLRKSNPCASIARNPSEATVFSLEVRGEVEASLPPSAREIDDYLLCFDVFDKKALYARLQPQISAVLTALRIGASGSYEFEAVAHGSYLITNDGKVVHSFSAEFGAMNAYVSSPMNDDQIVRAAADIELILKSGNLGRTVRLHAQSLDRATDNFRAFISAWSALEIFVGKIFAVYQRELSAELRKVSEAAGLHAYLDRVAEVMDGKHSLTDKFAVISMFLDDEHKAEEVETFRKLKKTRDRLSHGDDILENTLQTKEVQRLFEKYFRNHVRRNA